ncbi:MAG: hypothetical protein ACD_44C00085G0003 [uncultured bacterium]|nr:MAG: hypothetical protein ACD_44C00085G0003 [uncultured bacterium]
MMELMKDLWGFLKVRKKFWLLPIISVLLLFATLILISQNMVLAPFVYTIF